jgi:hypothetical protein
MTAFRKYKVLVWAFSAFVVLSVGISGCWWGLTARKEMVLAEKLDNGGAVVVWDFEGAPDARATPRAPGWLRGLFGEKMLGDVCEVFLGPSQGDSEVELISGAMSPVVMGLAGTNISDRGLRVLSRMRYLHSVHADNTAITDEGLRYLAHVPMLRRLTVAGTQITENGLVGVLAGLEELDISQTSVDLGGLGEAQQMRKLAATDLLFPVAAAKTIASLPTLEFLDISAARIDDGALCALNRSETLKFLVLRDCALDDAQILQVSKCKQLEGLDLRGTSLSDAGFYEMKAWKALRAVDVRNTRVSPKAILEMKAARPELKVVDSG